MHIYNMDKVDNTITLPFTDVYATIGMFDGIHTGHKKLITMTTADPHLNSVVITFKQNPVAVLNPSLFKGNLMTLEQKIRTIKYMGVKALILIDFSHDFSTLKGENFIDSVLSNVELKKLTIGKNFHCGRNRNYSSHDVKKHLEEQDVRVHIVDYVTDSQGRPVSSTRIRKALLEGNMQLVNELLGRPYAIWLQGIKMETEGNSAMFQSTAVTQLLPPEGVYSCRLNEDGADNRMVISGDTVCIPNTKEQSLHELFITGKKE